MTVHAITRAAVVTAPEMDHRPSRRRSTTSTTSSPSKPYADRLTQTECYVSDPDVQRRIVAACTNQATTPERAVTLLRLLVGRTRPDGTVSETYAQLAAANPFVSEDQIKRTMRALRAAGLVEQMVPGRRGRASVHRVTFLMVAMPAPSPALDDQADDLDDSPPAVPPDEPLGVRGRTPNEPIGVRGEPIGVRLDAPLHGINHGKTPRTRANDSGDTPPDPRGKPRTLDLWTTRLVEIARRRNQSFTPRNAAAYDAKLTKLARAAGHKYGQLDLDQYGAHLADVINSQAREQTLNPHTLTVLADAAAGSTTRPTTTPAVPTRPGVPPELIDLLAPRRERASA